MSAYDWEPTLDRLIAETEASEFELATHGSVDVATQRRDSGSYYTPADVADHLWDQFARFHAIDSKDDLRTLVARTHFVEPSAGSGIFVFTLIRKALAGGLQPSEIAGLRFTVIDINFAALQFVSRKLRELESELGIDLSGIGLVQRDFIEWSQCIRFENVAFVGNPPFVANPKGSRWRNLYADFLEAMLRYPAERKSISLILPLSVCFSRDYSDLRNMIDIAGMGVSASSYDNIPDSLFKAGKPESTNSNRANSQRCTILNLGGSDPHRREAAPLQRWATRQRSLILKSEPDYRCYREYDFDGQIPRPVSGWVMDYLTEKQGVIPARALMSRVGRSGFAVAGVARNFIGIRDTQDDKSGIVSIKAENEESLFVLLQIFGSSLFYDYWRSIGDGFHITSDLIERFPITPNMYAKCIKNLDRARLIWSERAQVRKSKLNAGKIIHSYDFREKFDYLI